MDQPPPRDHHDPELSLGYLVRRCHRGFDRLLSARLAQHDVPTGFWYYLRVLWRQDGLTQRQLSDATNVTETTSVAMLNAMARRQLIERRRDTVDRRKVRVALTDAGRALEAEMIGYAGAINALATQGIDAGEVAICADVLRRMARNLAAGLAASGE